MKGQWKSENGPAPAIDKNGQRWRIRKYGFLSRFSLNHCCLFGQLGFHRVEAQPCKIWACGALYVAKWYMWGNRGQFCAWFVGRSSHYIGKNKVKTCSMIEFLEEMTEKAPSIQESVEKTGPWFRSTHPDLPGLHDHIYHAGDFPESSSGSLVLDRVMVLVRLYTATWLFITTRNKSFGSTSDDESRTRYRHGAV